MKLIIAVLSNDDGPECIRALHKKGYKVTKLATSNGFLRAGNTTLLCGVDEDDLDAAIAIIKDYACVREEFSSGSVSLGANGGVSANPKVEAGGAVIFVLDVEQFIKV